MNKKTWLQYSEQSCFFGLITAAIDSNDDEQIGPIGSPFTHVPLVL